MSQTKKLLQRERELYALIVLFWGPLDVFFEFHLWFQKTSASPGQFATTVLILPSGICLPAAALMAFLTPFPHYRHLLAFVFSSVLVQFRPENLPSQLYRKLMKFL